MLFLLDFVLCCLSSTARSGFILTYGSIIAVGVVLLVVKYKFFTASVFLNLTLPIIPLIRVFFDFILAMISWLQLAAVGQRQRQAGSGPALLVFATLGIFGMLNATQSFAAQAGVLTLALVAQELMLPFLWSITCGFLQLLVIPKMAWLRLGLLIVFVTVVFWRVVL